MCKHVLCLLAIYNIYVVYICMIVSTKTAMEKINLCEIKQRIYINMLLWNSLWWNNTLRKSVKSYSIPKILSQDRSGNCLPGTTIDQDVCHPTEFDYYQFGHSGIKVFSLQIIGKIFRIFGSLIFAEKDFRVLQIVGLLNHRKKFISAKITCQKIISIFCCVDLLHKF